LVDGVVIWATMKFPSGVWITGENNSVYDSGVTRVSYASEFIDRHPNQSIQASLAAIPSFRSMVTLRTYGDDNRFGVSVLCDWFDRCIMARHARKLGQVVTPASKDGILLPFDKPEDASMLKRRFVRIDGEEIATLAPLELT